MNTIEPTYYHLHPDGSHSVANPMADLTKAARDVLAERQRQIEKEGYIPVHDDEHNRGELAVAAALYALRGQEPALWITAGSRPCTGWAFLERVESWIKRHPDRRQNLVRAAALLLAEIERMDRIVGINGLTEAETSATASVIGIVGMQASGVGGPTYYVRHPDDTYSVADPQPVAGANEV